jgi:hypothetical protein
MSQSNTQVGQIVLNSSEALTSKEGYLVKIINTSNVPEWALPDTEQDLALFIVSDGDAEDANSAALPLSPERSVRLKLDGACVPGDVLVLASIDGTHDGMVKALPAVGGTYRGIAIAEETGADGQLVKARPAMIGFITVV